MAETSDGIQAMRERMSRASRRPPAPRHVAATPVPAQGAPKELSSEADPIGERIPESPTPPARSSRQRAQKAAGRLQLAPDDAPVNLAIRVRRPLDDRLADLIHDLRGQGVRTSKVELVEMLLWELATDAADQGRLLERLGQFRTWAPRGAGAPLTGPGRISSVGEGRG